MHCATTLLFTVALTPLPALRGSTPAKALPSLPRPLHLSSHATDAARVALSPTFVLELDADTAFATSRPRVYAAVTLATVISTMLRSLFMSFARGSCLALKYAEKLLPARPNESLPPSSLAECWMTAAERQLLVNLRAQRQQARRLSTTTHAQYD